jgi:hypothetical protein
VNRRNLLRASGLADVVGLAGCLGRIQAVAAGPVRPARIVRLRDGFVLLVEARAPLAERGRLGPTVRFDPEWTGLGRLCAPIVVEDATDVDPALLDDAARVVCPLLARYRARRLPRSVTVSLHDAATGGRLDTIGARRTT